VLSDRRDRMSAASRSNVFVSLIDSSRGTLVWPLPAPHHQAAARASSSSNENCRESLKNSATTKALTNIIQLVVVAIPDNEGAAFAGSPPDLDLEPKQIGQFLLEGFGIGVLVARPA